MQDLGTLGGDWSEARSISADGSVIAGRAQDSEGRWRAFRWSAAGGMQNLEVLPGGYESEAFGISADGRVVVGRSENRDYCWRVFRWHIDKGMEDLNTIFARLLTDGSRLDVAYAASANGRYIVGKGFNAATGRMEGYLLDTGIMGDIDGNGCVDDADLLSVLFNFGQTGSNLPEDVNGDSIVDDADLLTVLLNFGNGC